MNIKIQDIDPGTYGAFQAAYDSGDREFNITIDSYGGSLDAAFRIYDLLRGDPDNKVTCSVRGNCISAATVILCAAPLEMRSATKNSTLMIHSPLVSLFCADINKSSAEKLKDDIDRAYSQLKSIYLERTSITDEVADAYMSNEKFFYADEALKLGFIGRIEEMYNKYNNNTNSDKYMNKIMNLVKNIILQLKNEKFKTEDGKEFEALSIEVGVPVDLEDGVYTLEDQTVITVEGGVIVDIIPVPVKPEPESDPDVVVNEGEGTTVEDPDKDGPKETEVEEAADNVEEEIKKAVEVAITELKEELINKYKPMVELVEACGGMKQLEALKNAKADPKNFPSNKSKSSLEELMDRVHSKK